MAQPLVGSAFRHLSAASFIPAQDCTESLRHLDPLCIGSGRCPFYGFPRTTELVAAIQAAHEESVMKRPIQGAFAAVLMFGAAAPVRSDLFPMEDASPIDV